MTGSELKLYFAILLLANKHRRHEFRTNLHDLRRLAKLSSATFSKTLIALEELGLIWVTGIDRTLVHICDPYTGEPMHTPDGDEECDPSNYHTTNEKGTSRRIDLNRGSREQIERLIRSSIPENGPVLVQGNGDLMIRCPFHSDSKPSCSVSLTKRCFQCFGCRETGKLTKLVAKLIGTDKAEAIKKISEATGQTTEFHDPDSRAIAKYDYRSRSGTLKKQVLRFPNDMEGNKVIRQRRPRDGGWVYNVNGMSPSLYHTELLPISGTVLLCEGEKDCDRATNLHLSSGGGMVVGLTSGGSGTWHHSLAKELRGHQVIVVPDDDVAGEKYACDIIRSLEIEGLEYRVVRLTDTGCKDISDYLDQHSLEDFVRLLGSDWVTMPDGNHLSDELIEGFMPTTLHGDLLNNEMPF